MSTKYVFVTGGVVSGLGKGITAASLGRLLKARGMKVTMQKLDPYLNVDPGTMNPTQHGEVFVTDDGAETDLDLGHYERFIDESLTKSSNATSGKIYRSVIEKERQGAYQGGTVQVIPHITNEIINAINSAAAPDTDVSIVEIGGTVGDIESQPFLEAIRQFSKNVGKENSMFIHVTLLPYLAASKEHKTKPTQHSVKELLSIGIQPDVVVLRSERSVEDSVKDKISLFCNIEPENVIANLDLPLLYEIPIALQKEGLDKIVCKHFGFDVDGPQDLSDWNDMVERAKNPVGCVNIAVIGKYTTLQDSYLSVVEALKHGGFSNRLEVKLIWVESSDITPESAEKLLSGADGIIIPGGFGDRGIDGMITAVNYARENKIPYFGICLGLQVAMIEIARNVLGLADADSEEFNQCTAHPVISMLPDQRNVKFMGNSMRLGKYPCKLAEGSKVAECYGEDMIEERHRHRYEVNNEYRERYESNGVVFAGKAPDDSVVEMIELSDHPWFVACQFHPEFKSRPNRPHPLFSSFIKAAEEYRERSEKD